MSWGTVARLLEREKGMGGLTLPIDVNKLAFEHKLVAAVHFQRDRSVVSRAGCAHRRDKKLVEPARIDEGTESPVAGPLQKERIGIEQLIETVDEDTGRQ